MCDTAIDITRLSFDAKKQQLGPCWRALAESPGDQTTPARSTGTIRALCAAIAGRGARPHMAPVVPWGKPLNCHVNARRYAREHGLKAQFGWAIWQGTNFVEAEPHAAVLQADGTYLCVTATHGGETNIMFLPDHARDITRREYAGDPKLWLFSGFHNVPAKDPRVCVYKWLTPKAEMADLKNW